MTARAKAYLVVRAVMLALLALAILTTGYGPFITSTVWAYPMFLCSAALIVASIWGTEWRARAALLLTVLVGSLWLGGFVAGILVSGVFAPISLIAWGGLVAIDLIMIRRPLTTPFEELLHNTL